jgi:hypothetical protein
MIKKWNNFILESHTDKQLSDIKDTLSEFMGDDKINTLINTKLVSDMFETILKYAEWRYDDKSKSIDSWYTEHFNKLEGWVGSTWKENLRRKKYGTKSLILSQVIDLFNSVKDEFNDDVYPSQSELSKTIELISVSTLDKLEFYECYETSNYVFIRIGCDDNLNVSILEMISDETIPMCARIKDELNLKNDFIRFESDEKNENNGFEINLGFTTIT